MLSSSLSSTESSGGSPIPAAITAERMVFEADVSSSLSSSSSSANDMGVRGDDVAQGRESEKSNGEERVGGVRGRESGGNEPERWRVGGDSISITEEMHLIYTRRSALVVEIIN